MLVWENNTAIYVHVTLDFSLSSAPEYERKYVLQYFLSPLDATRSSVSGKLTAAFYYSECF